MGVRIKEWPKKSCKDEVINDLMKLKLRNWSQVLKDRKSWDDVVQKIKNPCKVVVEEEEGEKEEEEEE